MIHLPNKEWSFTSYLFILFVILTVAVVKLVRITKSFEKEKDQIKQEFETTLSKLKDSLDNKNTASVSELVKYRLSAIEELYQDIRFRIKDGGKTKKVVPLTSVLKSMNERNEMMEVKPSESFWNKMRLSVDGEYNNIISFVEEHYPELTEQDIKIFCLLCANVTPQIIKLCMNFLPIFIFRSFFFTSPTKDTIAKTFKYFTKYI